MAKKVAPGSLAKSGRPTPKASKPPGATGPAFQFPMHLMWLFLAILLAVWTMGVYSGTVRQDLTTWDDDQYVTVNPYVTRGLTRAGVQWAFTTDYLDNYHPLTWLSLQFDAEISGNKPWAYKLTNLLLHTANGVLMYLLFWRMTKQIWPSFFVGALFALHPLHVESVAWVTERKDTLSTLFALASLHAYVEYARNRKVLFYILMLVGLLLSLLSKQMYVTLPLVFLLLDCWPLRRFRSEEQSAVEPVFSRTSLGGSLIEKLLPASLSLLAAAIIVSFQASGPAVQKAAFSLPERLGNALVGYGAYLRKAVLPTDLQFFYPYPADGYSVPELIVPGVLMVVFTIVAIGLAQRSPAVLVGWLWYVITLLPVIGIVQVGFQAYADRYTYFPLVGIFVAGCFLLADLSKERRQERPAILAIGVIALIACSFFTWFQVATWRNTETMARHALTFNERNPAAHTQLGSALATKGEWDEAKKHLETAIEIWPNNPVTLVNMGYIHLTSGDVDGAKELFLKARDINPQDGAAMFELGLITLGEGKVDEAADLLKEAYALNRGSSAARIAAGIALARQGKFEESIKYLDQVALANDEARRGLELVKRMQSGDLSAENRFRMQFSWPSSVSGARKLADQAAYLYSKKKMKLEPAIDQLTRSLELWGNNIDGLYNLAVMELQVGNKADAFNHFNRVLEIDPQHENALKALKPTTKQDTRFEPGAPPGTPKQPETQQQQPSSDAPFNLLPPTR